MIENKYFHLLLKFGEKKYMERFLDGEVYLNTVSYFKESENNAIGDELEGINYLSNLGSGTAQCGSYKVDFKNSRITQEDYLNKNLFCLSSLEDKEVKRQIKNNLVEINTTKFNGFTQDDNAYCVVIKNCEEFNNRMIKELKRKDLDYESGGVKYYDSNAYSGKVSLFMKSNKYSYQKEFRYVVTNNEDVPLILNIGSIRDIAELIPPNQIITVGFEVTIE